MDSTNLIGSSLSDSNTSQMNFLSNPMLKKKLNPAPAIFRSARTSPSQTPPTHGSPPGFPELELNPPPSLNTLPATTSTWDYFPFKVYPRDPNEDSDIIHSDDYENSEDFFKALCEKYEIK
jgi:hypothetical protein